MTPRALANAGRPGIGSEVFPESAKEIGRRMGLEPDLVLILRYEEAPDGGGDVVKKWTPDPPAVRGRLKSIRRLPHQSPIAGRVSETSTHLVELDPDVQISTLDRLKIESTEYLIVSFEPTTEAPFLQLEVKEA